MGMLRKLLGSSSKREVKKITPIVDKIESLADEYKALSDAELRAKTDEFRAVWQMERRWTTFCPRRLPPAGRLLTVCWVCAPTGFS